MLATLSPTRYLPESCRIIMPLSKSKDSPTYCYPAREVEAIVGFCKANEDIAWLGQVAVVLACIGMRISELAAFRWSDVDFDRNVVRQSGAIDAGQGLFGDEKHSEW